MIDIVCCYIGILLYRVLFCMHSVVSRYMHHVIVYGALHAECCIVLYCIYLVLYHVLNTYGVALVSRID